MVLDVRMLQAAVNLLATPVRYGNVFVEDAARAVLLLFVHCCC